MTVGGEKYTGQTDRQTTDNRVLKSSNLQMGFKFQELSEDRRKLGTWLEKMTANSDSIKKYPTPSLIYRTPHAVHRPCLFLTITVIHSITRSLDHGVIMHVYNIYGIIYLLLEFGASPLHDHDAMHL